MWRPYTVVICIIIPFCICNIPCICCVAFSTTCNLTLFGSHTIQILLLFCPVALVHHSQPVIILLIILLLFSCLTLCSSIAIAFTLFLFINSLNSLCFTSWLKPLTFHETIIYQFCLVIPPPVPPPLASTLPPLSIQICCCDFPLLLLIVVDSFLQIYFSPFAIHSDYSVVLLVVSLLLLLFVFFLSLSLLWLLY